MKHAGLRQPFLLTALCAAMLLPSAAALAVTDAEILKDATTTNEIVTNGLGLQGQRYSPLNILNDQNVKELRPVWTTNHVKRRGGAGRSKLNQRLVGSVAPRARHR